MTTDALPGGNGQRRLRDRTWTAFLVVAGGLVVLWYLVAIPLNGAQLEDLYARIEPDRTFSLGERFSAIDIYIGAMTHWRPRRAWFDENAPKLAAIADRALALPRLADVWARNYPG